jgi:hypothetical protein
LNNSQNIENSLHRNNTTKLLIIEEKPCPNYHNLKKAKIKKGKKNSPLEKERKINEKEIKGKEKMLTCLSYALLERTKIQTGKKKKTQVFLSFSFLFFSFRKKTTFCPRLFLSVFVFSASPATVRVATDVPHDHRTSPYHTSP